MKFLSFEQFFPQSIHYAAKRKPLLKLDNAQWQTLPEDSMVGGYGYAKGSQYKVFETKNFGWIVFHPDTRTPDGNIPFRRIHRF